MAWSNWIECKFDSQGKLDTSRLWEASNSSGVYAIATKTGSNYNTHYIGRSGRSIRGRLKAHLSGSGNKVIAGILQNKKDRPSDPTQALYFAYLETKEHKLIEAAYIDASDRPLGNLIKARLPEGLREGDIYSSELED
ncbi:GIY-YIG nuclease family protein [Coleofasciculus sp. H7-2]|uniref:GIY-YIG nuclease family protein n=1 Tax=Coleofasciculus sp. H7-2 TaxID=3351545 RepID=UPI00366FD5F0